MVRRIAFAGAILGTALLIFSAWPVQAGGKKSDSEVKVTAKADKPDPNGKQVLTVTLVHNKGWHTYANPVGNEDFDSNKTLITVLAKGKTLDGKVDYPPGKVTKDKIVGDYKVYEDKIEIKATVQRGKGETGPLEVNVRITACNESSCLLPATVKVTLP